MRRNGWLILLLALLAGSVAFCGSEAQAQFFRVAGQASWQGNTVVPSGTSKLVIDLVEVLSPSRIETVASRSVSVFVQPQPFSVVFAERYLRPGRSYALNFTIQNEGRTLYTAPAPLPVTAAGFRNRTVSLMEASVVQGGSVPTSITLSGSVFYLERILMPEGSFITFELQEKQSMNVWATLDISRIDSNNPPVNFTLSYDTTKWLAGATHQLVIYWKDAEGKPWFATAEPIPVTFMGWPAPKEIRVVRVVE